MTLTDGLLLAFRWLHALAATAWVGGNIFFYLVINPAAKRGNLSAHLSKTLGQGFYALVDACILVLILTGIVLTLDRLSSRFATVPYTVILGIKIGLGIWMFTLVRSRRQRIKWATSEEDARQELPLGHHPTYKERLKRSFSSTNLLLALGLVIFLLADLLRFLFEEEIKRG